MYYCKRGVNDVRFIIQRMKMIPESLRQEVTNKYEALVKPNSGYSGRDEANKYLTEISGKYKLEVKECEIRLKKPPVKKVSGKREYNSIDGLWSKQID